jgi:hypothetical protein
LGANHGLLLGFCRRPTRRPPGWIWFRDDKLADKRKTAKRLALRLQMLPRPGSFLLRPHCRACEWIVMSDCSLRCVMARRQFFSSEEMPPGGGRHDADRWRSTVEGSVAIRWIAQRASWGKLQPYAPGLRISGSA